MTDTRSGTEGDIAGSVDTGVFAQRYLAHAGSQLPSRDGSTLTALARDNLAFGSVRALGDILLRVHDLDGHTTAIDVVIDDAPYLVDSARAELDRAGTPVVRFLHPQIVVARDASGRLTHVFDIDDNADVPEGRHGRVVDAHRARSARPGRSTSSSVSRSAGCWPTCSTRWPTRRRCTR